MTLLEQVLVHRLLRNSMRYDGNNLLESFDTVGDDLYRIMSSTNAYKFYSTFKRSGNNQYSIFTTNL